MKMWLTNAFQISEQRLGELDAENVPIEVYFAHVRTMDLLHISFDPTKS